MTHSPLILAQRVNKIKPSPTLAVSAKAAELQATGQDVIGLGVGEPDFDTPEHIKEAGIKAIRDGYTKYTAVDGISSLKQAIINKFARDNSLAYQPKQILVSCGAKHSLFNLFLALLDKDDEIIIPAPYWVSYLDIALLCDAKPVVVEADIQQHYKITPQQLEAAITPRTKLLVLNSPSNPSGMAYTRAELAGLAAVLLEHPQVWVVSDDIYEPILWTAEGFTNILNVCPELYERCIIVNGVSKAYAMTGWRIGYAAGPQPLIAAMTKIQSQNTTNPAAMAQVAAQVALDGDQSCVRAMCAAFQRRHTLVFNRLTAMPGFECLPSDGTFYSFPRVQHAMDKLGIATDNEFAEYLLTQAKVAIVPGTAFGSPGHIRLSFAASEETLIKALDRIAAVL
jgi:aspartate aminotransferase